MSFRQAFETVKPTRIQYIHNWCAPTEGVYQQQKHHVCHPAFQGNPQINPTLRDPKGTSQPKLKPCNLSPSSSQNHLLVQDLLLAPLSKILHRPQCLRFRRAQDPTQSMTCTLYFGGALVGSGTSSSKTTSTCDAAGLVISFPYTIGYGTQKLRILPGQGERADRHGQVVGFQSSGVRAKEPTPVHIRIVWPCLWACQTLGAWCIHGDGLQHQTPAHKS
jgi:hypothetical protein